ncbi:hypothetical protein ABKA04_002014 [Annulohypoxylon sp. FPYF3050]
MSATTQPIMSEQDPTSKTKNKRLRIWKRQLLFNVESPDGKSTKVVGLIDGGSDHCLISKKFAKKAGLETRPLAPVNPPILEGPQGILPFQPIGYVEAKIRQPDLGLDTQVFLFVVRMKIPLLLGIDFNQDHGIESRIYHAVEHGIDPQDWDKDYCPSYNVCALIDRRSKDVQRKEEELVQQKRKETSERVLLAIQEMKKQQIMEPTSMDNFQTNQLTISSRDIATQSSYSLRSVASPSSGISSPRTFSSFSNNTSTSVSSAPSLYDAGQRQASKSTICPEAKE